MSFLVAPGSVVLPLQPVITGRQTRRGTRPHRALVGMVVWPAVWPLGIGAR